MTSKTYKTILGAFVIGGIALFTAGIIFLGGGKYFADSLEYTLYFDGSVSGLSIGAPVVFRGVPMGSVTKISLVANARDSNITIPVTIRIDDRSFIRADGESISEHTQAEIIQRMVERGLRARLQIGSFITGQYKIDLDFFPNTPMIYRSSNPDSEIPTIPSPIDTLQKTFASLPIERIANSLTTILASVTDAVGKGQLNDALLAFTGACNDARAILSGSGLRESLAGAFANVEGASKAIQKELPGALTAFQQAMASASHAADQLRKLSSSAENIISRDSTTMNELHRVLKEFTAAARAIRNFVDMLERNPEALIKGRQGKR